MEARIHRGLTARTRGLLALLVFLISGCAAFKVTFYDPTTYRDLTDIKPSISDLYDSYTAATLDNDKISAMNLKLRQMLEYEKGKGKDNEDTTQQIKLIIEAFESHAADRRASGAWSQDQAANKKEYILKMLDIAIESENLKNHR